MTMAHPFAAAADQRSAELIRDRSRPATGRVVGIYAIDDGRAPLRLVRFETPEGPTTTELALRPGEESGAKPIDLIYDSQQPSRVWRAHVDSPPGTSWWAVVVVFAIWLAACLSLALWLWWHPPKTHRPPESADDGRLAGTVRGRP
jgi:hypothetical protein